MAHGIGGRTVRELNEGPNANDEGMDVDEFLTWAAYFAIEPPIETRADIHSALHMAQIFNVNRAKGKAARKPADFLLHWYKPPKPTLAPGELTRIAKLQFLALGGNLTELD